jgi:hypothetical protein
MKCELQKLIREEEKITNELWKDDTQEYKKALRLEKGNLLQGIEDWTQDSIQQINEAAHDGRQKVHHLYDALEKELNDHNVDHKDLTFQMKHALETDGFHE